MNFRPLHDRVLVERVEQEQKTSGGIIIPDTAQEKPTEGKVVAVGDGHKNDEGKVTKLDVKKGDKLLFGKRIGICFAAPDAGTRRSRRGVVFVGPTMGARSPERGQLAAKYTLRT